SQIQGTGFGGRVTKKDVLAYLERRQAPAQQALERPGLQRQIAHPDPVAAGFQPQGPGVAPPSAAPAARGPAEAPVAAPVAGPAPDGGAAQEVLEPSAVRRTIAERMVYSWREIPHAWAMVEVDVTGLVRLRERL